jgi:cyclohexyl-isocyanide hydratase
MDRPTLLTAAPGGTALAPAATAQAQTEAGGGEHVAMLRYPDFTALDLVGPCHFLGATPEVTVHLAFR